MENLEKSMVPALTRALKVLEALARDPFELTLAELMQELKIPHASLRRILITLTDREYIIFDQKRRTYRLGFRFMYLGNVLFNGSHFRSQARNYLKKLAELTGETASLDVRIRNQLLIVDQVAGPNSVYLYANPGSAMPFFHTTAAGKIYLAHSDIKKVRNVMKKIGFPMLTPHTIDNIEKLEKEIKNVKRKGFAIDIEEMREGVARVAAPVYDESKKLLCCLTIACPAFKLKEKHKTNEFGKFVKAVASEMTKNLGRI